MAEQVLTESTIGQPSEDAVINDLLNFDQLESDYRNLAARFECFVQQVQDSGMTLTAEMLRTIQDEAQEEEAEEEDDPELDEFEDAVQEQLSQAQAVTLAMRIINAAQLRILSSLDENQVDPVLAGASLARLGAAFDALADVDAEVFDDSEFDSPEEVVAA